MPDGSSASVRVSRNSEREISFCRRWRATRRTRKRSCTTQNSRQSSVPRLRQSVSTPQALQSRRPDGHSLTLRTLRPRRQRSNVVRLPSHRQRSRRRSPRPRHPHRNRLCLAARCYRHPRTVVPNRAQRPNPPRINSPKRTAKNQLVDSSSERRRSCRSRRASDLSLREVRSGRACLFGKILVKLLIYSHYFTPSVGGVETIVTLLARKLADTSNAYTNGENFKITVATQTPADAFDDRTLPFPVVRTPSLLHLWPPIRSADVVHIAGPSLLPMFLAKLARTPYVVEHHGYQAIFPNG